MRVAVFGSSRPTTPELYKSAAFELGLWLAQKGHVCVNGGGGQGVMGAANRGVRSGNGTIVGVIHEMFQVDNDEDKQIPNMIVARGPDLNERKQMLMDNSDYFVVMPGGTGTFDELWDMVSHRSLGMKGLANKPIVLVNLDGFFDGSIEQLRRAYRDQILYNPIETYFTIATTLAEVQRCVEEHAAKLKAAAASGGSAAGGQSRDADSRLTTRPSSGTSGAGAVDSRLAAVAVGAFLAGALLTATVLQRKR